MHYMKKGISTILTVSIIMVLSMLSFFYLNDWFTLYQDDMEIKLEKENFASSFEIESINTQTLSLKNQFANNIEVIGISVGNWNCNLTSQIILTLGDNELNISSCTGNLQNMTTYDVKIITKEGIISETEILRTVSSFSSGSSGGGLPNLTYTLNVSNYYNLTVSTFFNLSNPNNFIFIIPSGAIVGANSTSEYALKTGTFPTNSNVTIINRGRIQGAGGNGGSAGGSHGGNNCFAGSPPSPGTGGNGGNALLIEFNVTINNTLGDIWGGGGGGGGGAIGSIYPGAGGGGGAGSIPGDNYATYCSQGPVANSTTGENGWGTYRECVNGAQNQVGGIGGNGGGPGIAGSTGGNGICVGSGEVGAAGGAAGDAIVTSAGTLTWSSGSQEGDVRGSVS